jgi:signal transduction histidine kinase
MRERVKALGGQLRVESQAHCGTQVQLEIPL